MSDPKVWTYTIRTRDPYTAWAKLFLDSDGAFAVISDHGNYAYHWSSWGDRDFREFLLDMDDSYLMGKLKPPTFKPELDEESSVKSVHEMILRRRREGDWDADKAREEWDRVKGLDCNNPDEWIREARFDEPWDFLIYTRAPGQLRAFVDRVWPLLQAKLKEALEES